MAADLSSILGGISQYLQEVGANRTAAEGALTENQDIRQQGVEALMQAATLESELAKTDMDQALKMEERKKASAAAFGTDILDPNNRIAVLARQQAEEVDLALAESRRASELIGQNIFDSPLSYLVQRPFAHRHVAASEAAKGRAQILDKAITDINQQTQSTIQTQAAINEQLSIDEAGQRAQLAALKAQDAVRAAQIATNSAYVNDLKVLQGFDEEKLKYATEAYKLQRHEQEFQARMAEMKANREARAQAKRTEEENLRYMFDRYNIGAELTGKTKAVDVSDFKAMMQLNKKTVADLINVGENAYVDPNTGTIRGQIDKTPGESIVTLSVVQGRLAPGAQRTSALLQNNLSLAQQNLRQQGGKITLDDTANAVNALLNGTVTSKGGKQVKIAGALELMSGNMEQDVGTSRNIFRAPDAETMATVNPSLAADPMWKQIVMPAVAASGTSPTVDAMVKQAQLGIREKSVTPEQASQFISKYFGAAMLTNGVNEQYQKVGIQQPKSYPVLVDGVFGSATKVDAANEQELRRLFAMKSIRSMRELTQFRIDQAGDK